MNKEIMDRFDQIMLKIAEMDISVYCNYMKVFEELNIKEDDLIGFLDNVSYDEDRRVMLLTQIAQELTIASSEDFLKALFLKYPAALEYLFEKDLTDLSEEMIRDTENLRLTLASAGWVPSVDTYDSLVHSKNKHLAFLGLERCSIEKLRELKTHKSYAIRSFVFERLGPKECLSDMLKDPRRGIREAGLNIAPLRGPELLELIDEVNLHVCCKLLKKGPDEVIALLVGNKNEVSETYKKLLNFRLGL